MTTPPDARHAPARELFAGIYDSADALKPTLHVLPDYPEYQRRNLLVCSAYGAHAGVEAILARLSGSKRPPKWLVAGLLGIKERTAKLPTDLARWRDEVGFVNADVAEFLHER